MGLHEYFFSQGIELSGSPFGAIIMAAMRKADTDNLTKLKLMWPEIWEELDKRYHVPGGILPKDKIKESGIKNVMMAREEIIKKFKG